MYSGIRKGIQGMDSKDKPDSTPNIYDEANNGHQVSPDQGRDAPADGEVAGGKNSAEEETRDAPGFLELIYGVLFDPVKTFRRIADSPPLGSSAAIFSLVKVLSVTIGGYISAKHMPGDLTGQEYGIGELLGSMMPAMVLIILVYQYMKWFVYSGLLYLVAELYGGRGRAVGILSVTGLASLPALLFLPLQTLATVIGGRSLISPLNVIFWLSVLIWGCVLVILGLRETQHISTGRAVLVTLSPAMVLLAVFIVMVVLAAGMLAPILESFPG